MSFKRGHYNIYFFIHCIVSIGNSGEKKYKFEAKIAKLHVFFLSVFLTRKLREQFFNYVSALS